MECACRLLETTDLSAREIGERVGFVESRYFYQVFKKYTGKTAFEYRASLSSRTGLTGRASILYRHTPVLTKTGVSLWT